MKGCVQNFVPGDLHCTARNEVDGQNGDGRTCVMRREARFPRRAGMAVGTNAAASPADNPNQSMCQLINMAIVCWKVQLDAHSRSFRARANRLLTCDECTGQGDVDVFHYVTELLLPQSNKHIITMVTIQDTQSISQDDMPLHFQIATAFVSASTDQARQYSSLTSPSLSLHQHALHKQTYAPTFITP